jgi:hypothetical protein
VVGLPVAVQDFEVMPHLAEALHVGLVKAQGGGQLQRGARPSSSARNSPSRVPSSRKWVACRPRR